MAAKLGGDGFAALQTVAAVLDRSRAARPRHRTAAADRRGGRARAHQRSQPQPDRTRPARLLHLLAGGDPDRVGIGRIGLAISESLVTIMAGLSRPKDGVLSHADVPATH